MVRLSTQARVSSWQMARPLPGFRLGSHERLKGLTGDAAMWHVTPEFVIELKSAHDRIETLRAKMREWTTHGVLLAWLINSDSRSVEIYRASGSTDQA